MLKLYPFLSQTIKLFLNQKAISQFSYRSNCLEFLSPFQFLDLIAKEDRKEFLETVIRWASLHYNEFDLTASEFWVKLSLVVYKIYGNNIKTFHFLDL